MKTTAATIPVPLQAGRERRQAERFDASIPVTVDGQQGSTLDLGTTGLSFFAEHAYEVGARVQVVIEYLLDGHHYPLQCEVEVVRSEAIDGGYKVGARLVPQSQLETVSAGGADAAAAASAEGSRVQPRTQARRAQ